MADQPKVPEKKEEKPAAAPKKSWIQNLEKEIRSNSLTMLALLLIIMVLLYWK